MESYSAKYVYWLHLIILPILVYVGVKKGTTPDVIFNIVLGIAIVVLLYHTFKLISLHERS